MFDVARPRPRIDARRAAAAGRGEIAVRVATIVLALAIPLPRASAGDAAFAGGNGAFLQALLGAWEGEAVETPIGPHPYDITFTRNDDGAVSGVADTGPSAHHWHFDERDGELHLRFLTTFRGNATPNHFRVEAQSAGRVSFRAAEPAYLRVDVAPRGHAVHIQVYLHEAPHVRIELTRRP